MLLFGLDIGVSTALKQYRNEVGSLKWNLKWSLKFKMKFKMKFKTSLKSIHERMVNAR